MHQRNKSLLIEAAYSHRSRFAFFAGMSNEYKFSGCIDESIPGIGKCRGSACLENYFYVVRNGESEQNEKSG